MQDQVASVSDTRLASGVLVACAKAGQVPQMLAGLAAFEVEPVWSLLFYVTRFSSWQKRFPGASPDNLAALASTLRHFQGNALEVVLGGLEKFKVQCVEPTTPHSTTGRPSST